MRLLSFKKSKIVSIGTELEFQIIDRNSLALVSRSKELMRALKDMRYHDQIKPEITQSMIEINSSIHQSAKEMYDELLDLQKIFPSKRFKKKFNQYRYLSKRATVFGQHIHIGCPTGDDAIYLTHALARYVPHFIAISASSPFYLGINTNYCSSRSTIFNAFPLSGVIPYLRNWQEFSDYYRKMYRWKIIENMKDFYWDIRPKPELGTIEIRVCDTPLTLRKSILITAYIQALALYLLKEKPVQLSHDLYYVYNYNRFQASRHGLEGELTVTDKDKPILIMDDILETIKKIEQYINGLGNSEYIEELYSDVINKQNDSVLINKIYKQDGSFTKLVAAQCELWLSDSKDRKWMTQPS
ncbi:TPA: glutamate--cysteine ligase [Legionella pneumophila subsp. pneumophila]|nr:glutamate--cysteine ligase [Legionella pneumophila subsp. pneumophila]HCE5549036.1 glutamate--cysteine ligase [Legionella pneumophila]HAT9357621.1 glutamate--cysteine ligase [Legionella pneumophila subsp. pneumophila]HAT9403327.1 glutamate--cysteine ligase [Legionella pneumophila subsp. pneumophila]HAT9409306.1 glutamate--cysteine ligase [Legionella pneumophila subsp. pneumophila]